MVPIKALSTALFLTLSLIAISATAQPYQDCGETPIAPAIVDGTSASMEQLVANSAEVNAYIEEADIFLDCQEAMFKRGLLARSVKEKLTETVKTVTARRNSIGDDFNVQVAAYKSANP